MADVELYKSFAAGMSDYIARHNGNYTLIETIINQILGQLTGQSGSLAVPYGLQEIFDRRGLIGIGSYDFEEGTLSGPDYNLTVEAGAYWNAGFYHKADSSSLSMAGLETGTYYLNLDAGGNPLVGTSADATTSRQFSWNASTYAIADKALYSGVNILFDGDDYADCLDSLIRDKTFNSLADRLEEIEGLLGVVQEPASADTVNINWAGALRGHARVVLDRATTTINMSGGGDGGKYTLELVQDATGGRAVTFGSMVQAGDDFTLPVPLSSGADKRDFLGFFYSGGNVKYNYVSLSRGY